MTTMTSEDEVASRNRRLAEVEAAIAELEALRARGVSEVSYNGETIRYRTDAEIRNAIRDLQRSAGFILGEGLVTRIVVGTSKGL